MNVLRDSRALLLALIASGSVAGAPHAEARAALDDARSREEEPAAAAEPAAEAPAKPERRWIKHEVVPMETLDSIGDRYGVTREEIVGWNKKKLNKKKWIYARQVLKIKARRFPAPREKVTYIVKRGDTWSKIAKRFGVPTKHLRGWNRKVPKQFRAGTKLKVYTDPTAPLPSKASGGSKGKGPLPALPAVRAGGIGIGKPNRGRLVGGVQLPKSDMYKVRNPDRSWGTTHTIELVQRSIAAFRRDSGYDKPLIIGAISLKKGGRFRPHSSHQTGRDVDIRLPRKPGAPKGESASNIDWGMTWALVKAIIDTGEVEYIFVSWSRQKYLYRAAKAAGVSKGDLGKFIQYPRKSGTNKGIVRHSPGHTVHLHIRFGCTPGNSRCVSY